MKTRRIAPLVLLVLVAHLPTGSAFPLQEAEDPPPALEEEAELVLAEGPELERLLAGYRTAVKEGDAQAIQESLVAMNPYRNEELAEPALDSLRYEPSKVDKAAAEREAEELGLRGRKELEELLRERVVRVRGAAVKLLSNFHENKKATSELVKVYRDKKTRKDLPEVHAATILALGALRYDKIEKDVFSEFRKWGRPDVARACCRYFGLIETKDRSIVRVLCESLSAPEAGNVDDPNNPPAAYWETRWKAWQAVRRDITWTLKRITGQVFRPQEGEHPGDAKKALEYVEEHARELGLR